MRTIRIAIKSNDSPLLGGMGMEFATEVIIGDDAEAEEAGEEAARVLFAFMGGFGRVDS